MHRLAQGALVCAAILILPGCSSKPATPASATRSASSSATASVVASAALPASAYETQPGLQKWVDPDSGYDTTRHWELEGGKWPVMVVLSPSQSPQALFGFDAGIYQRKLAPLGITPELQKLDGPPRVFHALERSQWPFVYMPIAVFMDYVRSPQNQGSAGGLQYVALAGSTAGGGYTLVSKNPAIKSVADLKGRTVAFQNTNPVPGTLLTKAAANAGLAVGDGPDDVHISFGPAGDQMNKYEAGRYDAMVTLNIYKAALFKTGSHPVTDFADAGYTANYTILVVERSVLEKRPEVVKAFLEAHYDADKLAGPAWANGSALGVLFRSWNAFFKGQNTNWSTQRPVPTEAAYKAMLGNMQPEIRLDRDLMADGFKFNTVHRTWGWPGGVDVSRIVDYAPFNAVLKANGEAPQ